VGRTAAEQQLEQYIVMGVCVCLGCYERCEFILLERYELNNHHQQQQLNSRAHPGQASANGDTIFEQEYM
jgi:hypothetical protein